MSKSKTSIKTIRKYINLRLLAWLYVNVFMLIYLIVLGVWIIIFPIVELHNSILDYGLTYRRSKP
jgi:hypothetical protein